MMKSTRAARWPASKPGGNRGAALQPSEAPWLPRRPQPSGQQPSGRRAALWVSCCCMTCRMLQTMCDGMRLDGTPTGGQPALSSIAAMSNGDPARPESARGASSSHGRSRCLEAASGAPSGAGALPCSHRFANGLRSALPLPPSRPLSPSTGRSWVPRKKGLSRTASAPARTAGGTVTSQSSTSMPSGPSWVATLMRFCRISLRSG
mmetsp:Transcript_97069/g.270088  ORF Transcript_97069/g.270088 Transcript_97069/m.270088 type:complete len:206 (-) Transcript_97069:288-905(-)